MTQLTTLEKRLLAEFDAKFQLDDYTEGSKSTAVQDLVKAFLSQAIRETTQYVGDEILPPRDEDESFPNSPKAHYKYGYNMCRIDTKTRLQEMLKGEGV
jgi:hypothetical protein